MRRIASVSLALTTMMVLLTGCNPYNKMHKNVDDIQAKANPEVLTLKGQEITTDITVTFPKKYFYEEMILKVTPVLVFEGGEIAGTPKYVQGEDVRENYTVIPFKTGGSYTQTVTFPYDARANFSTLELRIEGRGSDACRPKYWDYKPWGAITAAQGLSAVQSLADMPYMIIMPDNYRRVQTISEEAEIHYLVNSSEVRRGELTQEQIKVLQDFVKANTNNEDVKMGTIQAKGYASPEGPEQLNDRLSADRSKTGEKAIMNTMKGVNVGYETQAYGEDWDGFRKLVEASDMADKDLILQVLAMYDSSAKRDQEIKNLSRVFEELKKDILPQLRRTQLVATAEIAGKTDAEILEGLRKSDKSLKLEEMLFGATLTKDLKAQADAYKLAATTYNDARAYNNLGVTLATMGDLNGANNALESAARLSSSPAITNNLAGVSIMRNDLPAAKRYLSALNSPEATKNKGLVAMWEGDYVAASRDLDGYNLAVVEIINGNYAKAKRELGNAQDARSEYLRGVISMREGDSKAAINYLKSSIAKDPAMKAKAQKDVEFAKLHHTSEFKAL